MLDYKKLGNFNMERMNLNSTINAPTTLNFDFQLLHKPLMVLRTMNHRLRQEMMHLIHREQKLTVTDILRKTATRTICSFATLIFTTKIRDCYHLP